MRALATAALATATATLVLAASGTATQALADNQPAAPTTLAAHCGNTRIDQTAPVITRDNILIHAPLHTIWKIQTDVEKWPTWQPDVVTVVKDTPGSLRPGSVFRWTTEGLNITSTVKTVGHGTCLAWGGPAQGITAIHVWTFTPTRDGILVHTEESWTGAPVLANRTVLQAALDNSLRNWVNNLKHEAETRAAAQ
ncbi:SRPBCC family protein [Kitasatospora sp. NPDC048722]|uniref:SRPBCC family protein n=1 Tax=Kitasatospora sp. NPDC048722 TaxID=3155639 RepID=UPI0033EAF858